MSESIVKEENMNYDLKILIVTSILFIGFIIYDIRVTYNNCLKRNLSIIPPIVLHRIISVFMYTGWLYENEILLWVYLVFILCILLHWGTNKSKCILTQIENAICNFPPSRKYDLFYKLFGGKYYYLIYYFIAFTFIFVVIKLVNINLRKNKNKV